MFDDVGRPEPGRGYAVRQRSDLGETRRLGYGGRVSRSATQSPSIRRALALFAALFAISLGAFVPVAVAASAETGTPLVLCAGGQMQVVYVDDQGQPINHDEQASLKCAMALLSGLAATPAEDPTLAIEPASFESHSDVNFASVYRPAPPARAPPRPPSTAPPSA